MTVRRYAGYQGTATNETSVSYYDCDLASELPSRGVVIGDTGYARDTNLEYFYNSGWITIGGQGSQGSTVRTDGSQPFTGNESMGGNNLTNVAAPVNGGDAVNLTYITNNYGTGSTYVFCSPDNLTTTDNALIPWLPGNGGQIDTLTVFVKTPPTGQSLIVQFSVGTVSTGTVNTLIGTVTIAAAAYTATTSIAATTLASTQFLQAAITQVGSGTAGANMTAFAR